MAKMAARYGHFGVEELRAAVESISSDPTQGSIFGSGSLQLSLHSDPDPGRCRGNRLRRLVGAIGFEPTTPCAQGRCATRLRYAPTSCILNYGAVSRLGVLEKQSEKPLPQRARSYTEERHRGGRHPRLRVPRHRFLCADRHVLLSAATPKQCYSEPSIS